MAWRSSVVAAIGLLPVIAGLIFYNRWLSLFPQIEFRTWMWSGVGVKWLFVSLFTDQGAFSRSSTFFVDSATRAVCSVSVHCINEPGVWVILSAGYLLFWLIVRLTNNILGAAIASTLWVLSLPVLDAFAWQATLGDRLAALFGLATIHVGLWAMRYVAWSATGKRVAVANVAVLLPAILTYNSKEISWLLVPSLALLAVALVDGWDPRIVARHLSVLGATTAYAIFRTIDAFILIAGSSTSKSLDFGGDPAHNLKLYIAFLANHQYFTSIPRVLALTALVAVVFAIVRYKSVDPHARLCTRILLWAALSLGGGLIICLFTPFPGPYLLLLPSPFLWVALVALWDTMPLPAGKTRASIGVLVAGAVAAVMLVGLRGVYPLYGETLLWSKNFRNSLPIIARHVPVGARVDFAIGQAPFLAYRFVGTEGQRYIDQFIYPVPGPLVNAEARMWNVSSARAHFSGYSVLFNSAMVVEEIRHGLRVIYRADAGTS